VPLPHLGVGGQQPGGQKNGGHDAYDYYWNFVTAVVYRLTNMLTWLHC
jgi:hypothetical protein